MRSRPFIHKTVLMGGILSATLGMVVASAWGAKQEVGRGIFARVVNKADLL
jgi:hypothetical protein